MQLEAMDDNDDDSFDFTIFGTQRDIRQHSKALIQNSPDFKCLDLLDENLYIHPNYNLSICEQFLQSLRCNTTVQQVDIGCLLPQIFIACMSSKWSRKEAMGFLWDAIARLPELVALTISLEFAVTLSTLDLTSMLQKAVNLQVLSIAGCELQRSDDDDEAAWTFQLEDAIQNHANLKDISWNMLAHEVSLSVSPFFRAPNMSKLMLSGVRQWDTSIIEDHFSANEKGIRSLHLDNCQFDFEGWTCLAHFLQHPDCQLEKLCLSDCSLNDDVLPMLLLALGKTRSLQTLVLESLTEVRGKTWSQMAQLLACSNNCNLKAIKIYDCDGLTDDSAMVLAKALETNDTLREFVLHTGEYTELDCGFGPKGYSDFQDMLSRNYGLHELTITPLGRGEWQVSQSSVSEFERRKHFYLALNRSHLHRLQLNINATPSQFVDALETNLHDLRILYFLIRNNPCFVSFLQ